MFVFVAVLLTPSVLTKTFADGSQVTWQLVYLQKQSCHNDDFNVANMYDDLASKYLGLYQLDNTSYQPTCLSLDEFETFEKQDDLNLFIIVLGGTLGQDLLQMNNLDGLYSHMGDDRLKNHTVIVCDCSTTNVSYESALTPWILSHELSHFVLSYKGFSKYVIQNSIHEIEDSYDQCVANYKVDFKCKESKVTIRGEINPRDFVVMPPYAPAVGNSLIKHVPETLDDKSLDLYRELTSMWMAESIDDSVYTTTLKHLIDPPVAETSEEFQSLFQIENGFLIPEFVKNDEVDWQEHLMPINSEQKLESLLNFISPLAHDDAPIPQNQEIPNWFKARALLWSEKRISDDVFFEGVEHLVRMGTISVD